MPQHGTSAAQGTLVVTPPQAISTANMAELKEWFVRNIFPEEVLTRLLVPNPQANFSGISDVEDLGWVDEADLTRCGLPPTEFKRFYHVVRTDRAAVSSQQGETVGDDRTQLRAPLLAQHPALGSNLQ